MHLPSPSERLRRTAVTLINAPLLRFVRLVCPASVSTLPVHSTKPKLRSAMGYDSHRHVPPSWFRTTSTAFSRTGSRAYCISVPDGVRHVSTPHVLVSQHPRRVPATHTPLEEFHSPVAVPHHCGLCLPAVHATRTTLHAGAAGLPPPRLHALRRTHDEHCARVRSSRLPFLAEEPTPRPSQDARRSSSPSLKCQPRFPGRLPQIADTMGVPILPPQRRNVSTLGPHPHIAVPIPPAARITGGPRALARPHTPMASRSFPRIQRHMGQHTRFASPLRGLRGECTRSVRFR
jgi:hypothetical protein